MGKKLTELAKIKAKFALAYNYIKSFSVCNEANRHGELNIHFVMGKMLSPKDILSLEDAPIVLTDAEGKNFFSGICQEITLMNEAEYSEVVVVAQTVTIKADQQKKNRTFQSEKKKFSDIAKIVMKDYGAVVEVEDDKVVKNFLYQQAETDYCFLRRVANENGYYLFTDCKSDKIRLAIGSAPFSKKTLGEESKLAEGREKNISTYIKVKENFKDKAQAYEYTHEVFKSYDLSIAAGDLVTSKDLDGFCKKNELKTDDMAVINVVTITHKKGCLPTDGDIFGEKKSQYLMAKVLKVKGTDVKVQFMCDEKQAEDEAIWLPYNSDISNYCYIMPDEGDMVYVYVDNNGKVNVCGSRRKLNTGPDFSRTSTRMINSTNKMVKLTPYTVDLVASRKSYDQGSNKQSIIQFSDANGITIQSAQDITIKASKRLILQAAPAKVNVTAFIPFEIKNKIGEALYMAGLGMPKLSSSDDIKFGLGHDVSGDMKGSVAAGKPEEPEIIKTFKKSMPGGKEPIKEIKKFEEASSGNGAKGLMTLCGLKNCQFHVGSSHLVISGKSIKVKASTVYQLGTLPSSSSASVKKQGDRAKEREVPPDVDQIARDLSAVFPAKPKPSNGKFSSAVSDALKAIPTKSVKVKKAKGGAEVKNTSKKLSQQSIKKISKLSDGASGSTGKSKAAKGIKDHEFKKRELKIVKKNHKYWNVTTEVVKKKLKR